VVSEADGSLAPEYETAATTLKSKGDIKLAKVSLSPIYSSAPHALHPSPSLKEITFTFPLLVPLVTHLAKR
jgi:hypothetical protein